MISDESLRNVLRQGNGHVQIRHYMKTYDTSEERINRLLRLNNEEDLKSREEAADE